MKKYQTLKLAPVWKLFTGDAVKREDATAAGYSDLLTTADGRSVPAIDLKLIKGKTDLNTVLGCRVPCGTPSILVNRIESKSDTPCQIGIGVDWWFVCYLNGKELYSTLESGGNRNAVPEIDDHIVELPVHEGVNTLTILFLAGSSSRKIAVGKVPFTDLSPRKAELRNPPWLLNPRRGGCTVRFTTEGAMAAGVELRRKGGAEFHRVWETANGILRRDRELHSIELSGLEPGAEYELRPVLQYTDTNAVRITPEVTTFTAPAGADAKPEFSMFVTGDTQLMPENRRRMLETVFDAPGGSDADFFVHIGDAGSTFNHFEPDYFDGLMDVFRERTGGGKFYLPLRGNHEFFGRDCVKYAEFFGTPDGATFQAFRHAGCFFLFIETGSGGAPDPFDEKSYMFVMEDDYLKQEEEWLKRVAASNEFKTAEFRIVFAHAAPAMMCDWPQARQLAERVFGCGGIDLWIGGHVHAYRRTIPGTDRYLTNVTAPPPRPLSSGKAFLYPVITIDGPRETGVEISGTLLEFSPGAVTVTTHDLHNRMIDRFRLLPGGAVEELLPGNDRLTRLETTSTER
ncbi:MAG: metallophosphoesterase [Victivallaceae bacterium]|nr:metallophosphoesterase [Victivallaceae bacterium]